MEFTHINQPMTKKAISNVINACYRQLGLKKTVVFADRLMYTGFRHATLAGISIGVNDMVVPESKEVDSCGGRRLRFKEIQDQYGSGLVTDGERYNKVVDIWSRTNDQVAKAMMDKLGTETVKDAGGQECRAGIVQLDLHDGRLRCSWFCSADSTAGWYARPDGETGRLDHRDADYR